MMKKINVKLSSSGPGPGPRSGPKGPRTKDQRPGPGLYTKFGLPLTTHSPPPLDFSWGDNHSKPLLNDF